MAQTEMSWLAKALMYGAHINFIPQQRLEIPTKTIKTDLFAIRHDTLQRQYVLLVTSIALSSGRQEYRRSSETGLGLG